jgi:hypothetical protein
MAENVLHKYYREGLDAEREGMTDAG